MAHTPPEIPLGDVEIAQLIAASVRTGRPADRTPTLEQLLAAFGEAEPSPGARERVAGALSVAGVRTSPDVRVAPPGGRIALDVGARGARGRRALLGLLALVVLLAGAAGAALLLGGSDSPKTAADLPAGTTATTTKTTTTTTPSTTTTPTATASTPAATGTTTVGTVTTTPAQKKRRAARKRRRAAARTVRVTLAPTRPTYLCVKDGANRPLFAGTLSAPRTFRAKVVRLNIGLGPTTTVRVNGRTVALTGSPAGLELRAGGKATPLGTGQRPEC